MAHRDCSEFSKVTHTVGHSRDVESRQDWDVFLRYRLGTPGPFIANATPLPSPGEYIYNSLQNLYHSPGPTAKDLHMGFHAYLFSSQHKVGKSKGTSHLTQSHSNVPQS